MLAHLLKYDSVRGKFDGGVVLKAILIVVNGRKIKVYAKEIR